MSRLIDRLPEPTRIVEKKIICLSRSRCGTFSLYQALQVLGYRSYHMFECLYRGSTHMDLMMEALRCKYYGHGKPYTKTDFDKWLADYDAIVEIPQFFLEEFIEFYPNAQFILTERDEKAWMPSITHVVRKTGETRSAFPWNIIRRLDSDIAKFGDVTFTMEHVMFHGRGVDGTSGMELAIADGKRDSETAKRLVPKDQLLVARLEDGFGWEQMCPFLNIEIPETKYPRGNAPAEFDHLVGNFIGTRLRVLAMKTVGVAVLVALAYQAAR